MTAKRTEQLFTVMEARARIPISRTSLYALIGSGALRSVKVGSRRLIPESAITEYITGLASAPKVPTSTDDELILAVDRLTAAVAELAASVKARS